MSFISCSARRANLRISLACSALLGGLATSAIGAEAISFAIMDVEVRSSVGASTWTITMLDATYDPIERSISWNRTTPYSMNDPTTGAQVASVRSCSGVARQYPPRINLNFSITAGTAATIVSVRSALVSFPAMDVALASGSATASIGVQDLNNNGVSVLPIGPTGSGAFLAKFNGRAPSGFDFTELVGEITAGAGGSASAWQADPQVGLRPVGADVWSASVQTSFMLTAGDRATVQTTYNLQGDPTPIGDMNCDGRLNNFDIDPFVLALTSPDVYAAQFPGCDWQSADVTGDGHVDNFDIDAFIELIS